MPAHMGYTGVSTARNTEPILEEQMSEIRLHQLRSGMTMAGSGRTVSAVLTDIVTFTDGSYMEADARDVFTIVDPQPQVKFAPIDNPSDAMAAFRLLDKVNDDHDVNWAATGTVAIVPDVPPTAAGFKAYGIISPSGEIAYVAEPASDDLALYWVFSAEDLRMSVES